MGEEDGAAVSKQHPPQTKKRRKEEGKLLKRQRIEQAGGKRPRAEKKDETDASSPNQQPQQQQQQQFQRKRPPDRRNDNRRSNHSNFFGQVMDQVPCRGKPRFSTLSIALPGSILSNCQTRELRTQMVGQIARAATIYHVDEIIVFDDKLGKRNSGGDRNLNNSNFNHRNNRRRPDDAEKKTGDGAEEDPKSKANAADAPPRQRISDHHAFMARLFQYCECPQYLRRHFFPMHPDLQFAGLLAPIDAPHHVRVGDRAPFREGVVLDKTAPGTGHSLVNCGIRSRPVEINMKLQPGIRCTVQLDPAVYATTGRPKGKVVAPSAPRETDGSYWGYTTRMASSIQAAIDECPFGTAYDLKIGTSERGSTNLDDRTFRIPSYRHALVVFGGVHGIEECVNADESIALAGSDSRKLFDMWVNICPFQGSRTIRTEEAVLIALAKLSPVLAAAGASDRPQAQKEQETKEVPLLSSDNSLSSEESGGDSCGSEESDAGQE